MVFFHSLTLKSCRFLHRKTDLMLKDLNWQESNELKSKYTKRLHFIEVPVKVRASRLFSIFFIHFDWKNPLYISTGKIPYNLK